MGKTEIPKNGVLHLVNRYKAIVVALVVLVTGIILITVPIISGSNSRLATLSIQLGIVLIPSGLIALIYELTLRRTFLDEMQEQLTHSLKLQFHLIERFRSAGLIEIHDALPIDLVIKAFSESSKQIRVLQTCLPEVVPIECSFKEAASRGCRIQILLVHPTSYHASARSADMGYDKRNAVSGLITTHLDELARFCSKERIERSVEIRLYNGTPIFSLYSCDQTMYLGLFWRKQSSSQGPHLEFMRDKGSFSDAIERHFSDLWGTAKPYSISSPADE